MFNERTQFNLAQIFQNRQHFITTILRLVVIAAAIYAVESIFSSFTNIVGLAFAPAIFGMGAGGGDGGDDYSFGTVDQHTSDTMLATQDAIGTDVTAEANMFGGFDYSFQANVDGLGTISWSTGVVGSSTPFLKTWNGFRFEHENDFLFGKPQTAFKSYEEGLAAYQHGIGGDTYILNNKIVEEGGKIKMEIHEIEPEESYIDSLQLAAIDLNPHELLVVNGNLRELHVFDTKKVTTISTPDILHVNAKTRQHTHSRLAYTQMGELQSGSEVTLATNDELILKIPKATLQQNDSESYILVDSYFRDWTLGKDVPFSFAEQLSIQASTLGRRIATTAVGVVVLATGFMSVTERSHTDASLKEVLRTPHVVSQSLTKVVGIEKAYADTPHNSKSLVVAAQIGNELVHLETLFPRFVQASQEVVKIPRELISKLKDEYLYIRIRATKKHIVRAAFVFSGVSSTPKITPLTLKYAYHSREQKDYAQELQVSNKNFLHTEPADVVSLTYVAPENKPSDHMVRKYVLQAQGFYTRMSKVTKQKLGDRWYQKLAIDDRRLLKVFRKSR